MSMINAVKNNNITVHVKMFCNIQWHHFFSTTTIWNQARRDDCQTDCQQLNHHSARLSGRQLLSLLAKLLQQTENACILSMGAICNLSASDVSSNALLSACSRAKTARKYVCSRQQWWSQRTFLGWHGKCNRNVLIKGSFISNLKRNQSNTPMMFQLASSNSSKVESISVAPVMKLKFSVDKCVLDYKSGWKVVGIDLGYQYDKKLFRRYTGNIDKTQLYECQFAHDAALLVTARCAAERAINEY